MAASLNPSPGKERASILLVDDAPEKLLALRAVLAELGEEIVEARSGRAALRELLAREFAVILLDINMPGMDGFETAALIRQRRLSEHTPIIFITAYNDDTHVARGYSLGAVDYIVAPVVPEVLKSKVSVFVDLFRKAAQIRSQADSLSKRNEQLQRLTRASLAINAALSLDAMLRVVAESARSLLAACTATVSSLADDAGLKTRAFSAGPAGAEEIPVAESPAPRETARSADGGAVVANPDRSMMSVALVRRDGTALGWIHVEGAPPAAFDPGDEALLVSLAQMSSIAIENSLSLDLREANRLKDEFLATLSHELRTPLSAVLGWATLLRSAPSESAQLAHGLEVIERNTLSQVRMVEDLLDISRITHGKLRVSRRDVALRPLLETAVDAMRPAALAKGVALRLEPDAGATPAVSGDAERLQQVFRNLLSNAVKFTRRGGHVNVSLEQLGDDAVVAVCDDGAGISPSFLEAVFERFRQADGSSSRLHSGLGIGLAIVRHIVDAHGGTVVAESPGVGAGATFTVRLPVLRGAGEMAPATRDAGELPVLGGLRVLLVDDEPDGRDATAEFLAALGADVTPAGSMAEALSRLAPSHDVLVSDIGMPSGDGYELLARIRTLPPERGGRVPALALTAYALPEDRRRILAAGFAAHVAKPVDPAALVHAVYDLTLAAGRSEAGRPGARRVLVVDDDEDYLEATRALLETGGFIVDVAASGQEAVQKARRNRPAAALVDSRLPDMSGIEVAEALRTEAGPEELLIVATSGFSPLDAGERAVVFDAWLTKPLDLARLTALLEHRPAD